MYIDSMHDCMYVGLLYICILILLCKHYKIMFRLFFLSRDDFQVYTCFSTFSHSSTEVQYAWSFQSSRQ
jgi:hypothetical protein